MTPHSKIIAKSNLGAISPSELQKRANRANQLALFFLAGANFWEKHAKNTQKQAKNRRFFGANFFGGKIGANFYAFCNYDSRVFFWDTLHISTTPLKTICKAL